MCDWNSYSLPRKGRECMRQQKWMMEAMSGPNEDYHTRHALALFVAPPLTSHASRVYAGVVAIPHGIAHFEACMYPIGAIGPLSKVGCEGKTQTNVGRCGTAHAIQAKSGTLCSRCCLSFFVLLC